MKTIKLDGIIKLDEVVGFHERLKNDISQNEDLCFDMSDIEQIDTSGLQLLISLSEQLRKTDHKVELKGMDEPLKEHLKLLDITKLFEIAA